MNPTAPPSPSPAASLPSAASNNQPADSGKAKQNMWQKKTFGLPGWTWIPMVGLSQAFTIFAIIFMLVGIAVSHSVGGEITKAILSFREAFNQALGIAPGSGSSANGSVDCAGDVKVPAEYLPTVADASNKYLGGDQAVLIALIEVESSWKPNEKSPTGPLGLGQFTRETASDPRLKADWGTSSFDGPPNDPRLDPIKSIFATAHWWSIILARYNKSGTLTDQELYDAYGKGYNTGLVTGADPMAGPTAQKLVNLYHSLKNGGGCKATGGTGPVVAGEYYPPLGDIAINHTNDAPHGTPGHDLFTQNPIGSGYSQTTDGAIDLFTNTTSPVYSSFSGTVTDSHHYDSKVYKSGGHVVWIRGDDGTSGAVYGHIQSSVNAGTHVTKGQQIGNIAPHCGTGAQGDCVEFSGEIHLHYQLYIQKKDLSKADIKDRFHIAN